MENFEKDFDSSGYFDDIALVISENSEEMINFSEECSFDEIYISCDNLSSSDLITSIEEVFETNVMNEHLATIELLGNLGYADMLMYYCVVMDCIFIVNELENNEQTREIVTPGQYINDNEAGEKKVFDLEMEVSKSKFPKLIKVLKYLKNKEFKILSNTFYMDGSDFIICLSLKSVVGYNLRIKIVFKFDSLNEVVVLNEGLREIQKKYIACEE